MQPSAIRLHRLVEANPPPLLRLADERAQLEDALVLLDSEQETCVAERHCRDVPREKLVRLLQ